MVMPFILGITFQLLFYPLLVTGNFN